MTGAYSFLNSSSKCLSNNDQYIYIYMYTYLYYMIELTFTYIIDIYNKLDTRLRYKKYYTITLTDIYSNLYKKPSICETEAKFHCR